MLAMQMNFKQLYKKTSGNHFLSLAGNIAMAALGVITYSMLYRLLGENEMGSWIFFQTLFALADAVRTGFLQTAFIKFYSGAGADRKENISGATWYIAIIISLVIGLLCILSGFAVSGTLNTITSFFMIWYGINFIITCPYNVTLWTLQADGRFGNILWLRVINQGSFIICLILLVLSNRMTIWNTVMAYILCSLLSSAIPFIRKWASVRTISRRAASVKEIVLFGRYSVGTYLCSTVFKYSDSLIINFMIGPAALAVYNLAQRLLEVIEIFIRSFIGTAMPAMSVAFNSGEQDKVANVMKKYTGALTLLLIPVIAGMLISADLVVALIGGHKYAGTEAANILRLFMLSAILFPLDRFSGITLDIIHKPELNFIKIIFSLLINVAGDILAIQLFGNLYGVAIASVITLAFGASFGYIKLNQFLPFSLSGTLQLGYMELRSLVNGIRNNKPVL